MRGSEEDIWKRKEIYDKKKKKQDMYINIEINNENIHHSQSYDHL